MPASKRGATGGYFEVEAYWNSSKQGIGRKADFPSGLGVSVGETTFSVNKLGGGIVGVLAETGGISVVRPGGVSANFGEMVVE